MDSNWYIYFLTFFTCTFPAGFHKKTSAYKNTGAKELQQHPNVVSSFFFFTSFFWFPPQTTNPGTTLAKQTFYGGYITENPYWEKYQLHTPFVWPFFSQTTCHWTNNIGIWEWFWDDLGLQSCSFSSDSTHPLQNLDTPNWAMLERRYRLQIMASWWFQAIWKILVNMGIFRK